jgi:hypothetical protein
VEILQLPALRSLMSGEYPATELSQFFSAKSQSQGYLRLAVCRQSVLLGVKPLETHEQRFFELNLCGHNPYVTISLTRGWVCRS